jgi:hypothetical protein
MFPYVIKSVTGSCGNSTFISCFSISSTLVHTTFYLRVVAFMAANMALAEGGTNVREASVGVMRRTAAGAAAAEEADAATGAATGARAGTDARDFVHTESGNEYKNDTT